MNPRVIRHQPNIMQLMSISSVSSQILRISESCRALVSHRCQDKHCRANKLCKEYENAEGELVSITSRNKFRRQNYINYDSLDNRITSYWDSDTMASSIKLYW
jgi:hypothetical protein